MKYQELLDEYKQLLQIDVQLRQQLNAIPKGYIVTKKISGKAYFYLQYSKQGKKKSEYINENNIHSIKSAIASRKPLKEKLEQNQMEQNRLERAVQILDPILYNLFWHMKQCTEMDAMPIDKRPHALSFAKAMTSLEGILPQEDTEKNLQLWATGKKAFIDIYIPALYNYKILEVT